MSLPRFEKYKHSGTDWLGEIPNHWRLVPLWTLFQRTKRTGFEDEQLLSVYRDFGVVPKASRDDNNDKPSDDLSVYQLVEPGDLAINKMKAWQGAVAISSHRGIVSPAYFVYESRHGEDGRFLHYLLRSPRYITGYLSISKGIRVNQWDLEPQYHSRMPVLLPPLPEQTAIATFLDHETAKIDALIAEQEKLISLLAEKRQATISHAVTRGLNPDAPMKDSGVAWLGEVPAHWVVQRLSTVSEFRAGKAHEPYISDDGEFVCVNARFVSTQGDSIKRCTANLCPAVTGDILMVMSDLPNGRALARAYHVSEDEKLAINQRVCAISVRSGVSRFFYYQLNRNLQLLSLDDGVEQTHLSNGDFRRLSLLVPPESEQKDIAKYLDRQTKAYDSLIQAQQTSVSLLQERRAALIAAAVTGQIDVRGWVQPQREADPA